MKNKKRTAWLSVLTAAILLAVGLTTPYLLMNAEHEELNEAARADLPGQFIPLSQGVTHYETGGTEDGQPVLLVHGFSAPSFVWDPLWQDLAENGFYAIRFDLYGRGYSDRPAVDYNTEVFTTQIDELITALEVSQPVNIIALSLGGAIAAAYTNQHPQQVRRLVLIDPQSEDITPQKIFPVNLPGVGEYLMTVYILPERLMKPGADFADPQGFPQWETAYRPQIQYRGFRRALLSTLRHFDLDVQAQYRQLSSQNISVLIVWGEKDTDVSREAVERTHQSIQGSQLFIVENAGHNAHYERPDLVNPVIVDFLSQ